MPSSLLHYWSSVALQRGLAASLTAAMFDIHYRIKLVPVETQGKQLIRRPRTNWTICSCRGNVKGLTVNVKKINDQSDASEVSVILICCVGGPCVLQC